MVKALGSLVAVAGVVALGGTLAGPALAEPASQAAAVPAEEAGIADSPDLEETPSYVNLVADAQRLLNLRGFDPGPIDGQLGLRTLRAIRAYQAQARARGLLEALKGPAPVEAKAAEMPERPQPVRIGQAASAANN